MLAELTELSLSTGKKILDEMEIDPKEIESHVDIFATLVPFFTGYCLSVL